MAETAGRLRAKHPFLKGLDCLQLGAAIETGVDAFLTNDISLGRIDDIKVLVLRDYL